MRIYNVFYKVVGSYSLLQSHCLVLAKNRKNAIKCITDQWSLAEVYKCTIKRNKIKARII